MTRKWRTVIGAVAIPMILLLGVLVFLGTRQVAQVPVLDERSASNNRRIMRLEADHKTDQERIAQLEAFIRGHGLIPPPPVTTTTTVITTSTVRSTVRRTTRTTVRRRATTTTRGSSGTTPPVSGPGPTTTTTACAVPVEPCPTVPPPPA